MRLSEWMCVVVLCGWCVYILSYFITSTNVDILRAADKKSKSKVLAAQLKDLPKLGTHHASLGFIVMGDFGTGSKLQAQVATSLGDFVQATKPSASFVISTGDQIYDHGLLSADDPAIISKFEMMYKHPSLQIPWYISIGNHDCEGNIEAMLGYSKRTTSLWRFPQRYYNMDHRIDNSTIVRFLVLDACDLVCGQEPEFKDYRCTPAMDAQTSITSRRLQYEWIEKVLSMSAPKSLNDPTELSRMWTVVIAHWGVYSYAGNGDTPELMSNLVPLLEKYNVHAYFNGHDHALEHVRKGSIQYFTSGAGGYKLHELKPQARSHPELIHVDMTNGFMWVEVSHDTFRVQFVDGSTTEVLYTTDVPYRSSNINKEP
ncbi:unnamed protein product [Aphanomyces euteiches]|uniref:Calcineurin-like phosphoesterase domain-containing protein n=1 Tax=Aphanomyces euteiches TaxID=100861 RepID=A0A6G0XTU5_9STRA|nr:hypothetical protein Ae201684_001469 [Aphanomyces euteiches]KAH9075433.1 hypothetical protein Ae201684P_004113 [Aphanomyces euteiches]KAH9141337.1 hypothetical protein AeRB84_014538 [Aphanomyces euteiches]